MPKKSNEIRRDIGEYITGGTVVITFNRESGQFKVSFNKYTTDESVASITRFSKEYHPEPFRTDTYPNNIYWEVYDFINDHASSYYAEQIIDLINENL